MKPGDPISLKAVLDPKPPTIEMVASPSTPMDQGASTDGFSFATHTTGGTRRKLSFCFKVVAFIFLGWTVLGLIVQAAAIVSSLLQS